MPDERRAVRKIGNAYLVRAVDNKWEGGRSKSEQKGGDDEQRSHTWQGVGTARTAPSEQREGRLLRTRATTVVSSTSKRTINI
jgi:hypothetical protein